MLKFARIEYVLFVDSAPKANLVCRANATLPGLKIGKRIELLFDYRGQTVTFTARVEEIKGAIITLELRSSSIKISTEPFRVFQLRRISR
jgi:hypothetical protein